MIHAPGVLTIIALGLLASETTSHAQAVTTAAVYGRVFGADSTGIEEATVALTNTATGERWQVATRGHGLYYIEYVSLGGPYAVAAHAIGFQPARKLGVTLSLAERERVDFRLVSSIVTLPEIGIDCAQCPHQPGSLRPGAVDH